MSMTWAEFGPYEMFAFLPVVYWLTLGDAQLGVGSVVRLVVGGPAHALSSPATASPTHIASRPPRRSLRMVMPSPLAGYCLHSRRGSPVTSAHGGSRLVGARTHSSLDITSVTGLWSGTTPLTQGGNNGGMAAGNLTEALILRLALQGLPLPAGAEADDAFRLVSPILARNREQSRRLADRPCPADRRIQGFLDSYLADAPVQPQLPRRTLVLDQPGLARQLSLPRDSDEFSSNLLSSYRLANGVLHNPASDRRTTAGVFHIAEGGLPIQDDKLAVPKATFAKLLEAALQPPADALVLPWTSTFAEPARTWVSLLLRPLVVPATPAYPSDRTMETRFIVPGGLVANLDFVEGIFGSAGDARGVVVTIIADTYFGYCKKEVKTQISYAANLFGISEEEHSGGAICYPAYNLGQEFTDTFTPDEYTLSEVMSTNPGRFELQPEGHAIDRVVPGLTLVPAFASYSLRTQTVSWTGKRGEKYAIPLTAGHVYISPNGYRVYSKPREADKTQWHLLGISPIATQCHKPATVSGGGKSEISKSLLDAFVFANAWTANFDTDIETVADLIATDFADRYADPNGHDDHRPMLSDERSLGSVIKLMTC